jgi:hypothetical protein
MTSVSSWHGLSNPPFSHQLAMFGKGSSAQSMHRRDCAAPRDFMWGSLHDACWSRHLRSCRTLHKIPELAFEEDRTSAYIR